jgi:acyl carrier protein
MNASQIIADAAQALPIAYDLGEDAAVPTVDMFLSNDFFTLLIEVEERIGCRFAPGEVSGIRTNRDLRALIERHTGYCTIPRIASAAIVA